MPAACLPGSGSRALVAALLVLVPTSLVAQSVTRNHLHDKFQVTAGLAGVGFSGTIRVDPSGGGDGTEVDPESELGLSKWKAQPRLGLRWNLSRSHELEFQYQFARRNGEQQITGEIEFEDEVYEAGLLVRTSFDSDVANLTWRWAFHSSEKSKIGATLFVGGLLLDLKLDGYATVSSGGQAGELEASAAKSFTAPIGGVGAFGRWRLSDRWYLDADLRGLYVPIDRFEARVFDAGAAVRFFPIERLGVEFGYALNSVRVDVNPDPEAQLTGDFSGLFKYALHIPRLGLVYSF